MMAIGFGILAVDDGAELFYVIAVLILAAVGAIVEKLKQKMGGSDAPKRTPPVPRRADRESPPPRPAAPSRPAARPVQRPAAPPRPAQRQAPAVRPAVPARPLEPGPRRPPPPASPRRPEPVEPMRRRALAESTEPPGRLEERQIAPVDDEYELGRVSRKQLSSALLEDRPRVRQSVGGPAHPPVAPSAGQVHIGSFTGLGTAELRRAIVLYEVLGPPVALRDPGQMGDRF